MGILGAPRWLSLNYPDYYLRKFGFAFIDLVANPAFLIGFFVGLAIGGSTK